MCMVYRHMNVAKTFLYEQQQVYAYLIFLLYIPVSVEYPCKEYVDGLSIVHNELDIERSLFTTTLSTVYFVSCDCLIILHIDCISVFIVYCFFLFGFSLYHSVVKKVAQRRQIKIPEKNRQVHYKVQELTDYRCWY